MYAIIQKRKTRDSTMQEERGSGFNTWEGDPGKLGSGRHVK